MPKLLSGGKIFVARMFEDEDTARPQNFAVEHHPDDLLARRQIVGRIRENQVELFGAAFQVEKNVRFDGVEVFDSELPGGPADEIVVYGIDLDRGYAASSARCEFVTDGTRAGEEVQHVGPFVIDEVVQHVEQVFFRKIRRGPCP